MTETIVKDYADSARAMTQDALAELAKNINEHHAILQSRVDAFRSEAGEICAFAIQIAKEVETAHATLGGRRFKEWWDDQKLPVGWSARYLTLAKTSDRHTLGDKDQMRLIGILPEAETHNDGQQRRDESSLDWIKHAGKIRALVTPEKIATMGDAERRIAWKQLEPLFDVMLELKRLTGDTKGR